MSEFITFVIPAYNVADYIDQCILSVVHQTNSDWKAVLVDDGSTDGRTLDICNHYAQLYPDQIICKTQKNKGLGGARNTGLDMVASKYVMFFDSDDFLDINLVENLKKREGRFANQQLDMIFTLPIIYDNLTGNFEPWYDVPLFYGIFNKGEYQIPSLNEEMYSLEVNACRKVYRTEFLKDLNFLFDENLKYEDFFPHYYLLSKAGACAVFDITSFYYRINRPNQITKLRDSSRMDVVKVISKTFDLALRNDFEQKHMNIIIESSVKFSIWCINNSTQDIRSQLIDKLSDIYSVLPTDILSEYSKNASRKNKYFIKAIRSKMLNNLLEDYLFVKIAKKIKRRG